MFDTGCFRYSNTTPETHQIAAELMEIGEFPPDEVYRNVYEQLPVAKLRLLSEVLKTLQVTDNEKSRQFTQHKRCSVKQAQRPMP